jgi:hypothetical protein
MMQVAHVGYDQFRPSRHLRRWSVNVNQWTGWNFDGDRIATGGNINGSLERPSFRGLSGGINREFGANSVSALRGGPLLATPGRTNVHLNAYTDRRKPLSLSLSGSAAREDGTGSGNVNVSPTVRWRPSNQMELAASPRLALSRNTWQYVAQRTVAGERHYVFGELNQTTASLTMRAGYTFAPNLSLQFYAQPFLSAGGYDKFSEVADPRTRDFGQRFRQYPAGAVALDAGNRVYRVDRTGDGRADFAFNNPDFNVKQLRTNTVLRWEYSAGSTLYFVWSQGRSQRDVLGGFDFNRDAGELLRVPATNVLLVKFSYLLGV